MRFASRALDAPFRPRPRLRSVSLQMPHVLFDPSSLNTVPQCTCLFAHASFTAPLHRASSFTVHLPSPRLLLHCASSRSRAFPPRQELLVLDHPIVVRVEGAESGLHSAVHTRAALSRRRGGRARGGVGLVRLILRCGGGGFSRLGLVVVEVRP